MCWTLRNRTRHTHARARTLLWDPGPGVGEVLTVGRKSEGSDHTRSTGQVDYDRLRPLFYPNASVVLLCFDVTSPHSFENIFTRVGTWGVGGRAPKARPHCSTPHSFFPTPTPCTQQPVRAQQALADIGASASGTYTGKPGPKAGSRLPGVPQWFDL